MARINLEDSIFKDQRWMNLLLKTGCYYKALGLLTSSWILAQENWINHKSIPRKAWSKDLDILIEVELAEILESGDIYIKGSKNNFKWLEQRVNAGKLGGLSKRPLSDRLATAKRPLQPAKPLTLTLPLTLIKSDEFVVAAVAAAPTATEIYEMSFSEDAQKLKKFFKENKMSQLFHKIPIILKTFQDLDSFENWYIGLTESKIYKDLKTHSEKMRYVVGCLKKEIGEVYE